MHPHLHTKDNTGMFMPLSLCPGSCALLTAMAHQPARTLWSRSSSVTTEVFYGSRWACATAPRKLSVHVSGRNDENARTTTVAKPKTRKTSSARSGRRSTRIRRPPLFTTATIDAHANPKQSHNADIKRGESRCSQNASTVNVEVAFAALAV